MRLISFARRFLAFGWLRPRGPAMPFSFRSMGIARRSSHAASPTRRGDSAGLRPSPPTPSRGERRGWGGSKSVTRRRRHASTVSLRGGEAFSMRGREGDGRELRDAAFIGGEEMSALRAALEAGQESRAAAANAALRRDPALIALLTFEDPEAASGVFREVQGRWPGSRAPCPRSTPSSCPPWTALTRRPSSSRRAARA